MAEIQSQCYPVCPRDRFDPVPHLHKRSVNVERYDQFWYINRGYLRYLLAGCIGMDGRLKLFTVCTNVGV